MSYNSAYTTSCAYSTRSLSVACKSFTMMPRRVLALLALALMMQWSSVSGQQYLGGSGGDSSGCSNTCYHCASMHSPFSDALPSAAASVYARAQCALLEGSAGGVDYYCGCVTTVSAGWWVTTTTVSGWLELGDGAKH